jgi:hypothetical protein
LETNRRSCLCQICCNVALKVEAANNFINGRAKAIKHLTKTDVENLTLCPYETEYPHAKCLRQECEDCGPHKIREYFEVTEEFGSTEISYHRCEAILLQKKTTQQKDVFRASKRIPTLRTFYQILKRI